MPDYKRPKELKSLTVSLDTPTGKVYITFCYDDKRLVELHGILGKGGNYASMQLETICRLISIILQAKLSRAKIMKKIKKNFYDMKWETPFTYENKSYTGYEDFLFKALVCELNTKKLYKRHLCPSE